MAKKAVDKERLFEVYSGLVFKETLVKIYENYHNICEHVPEYLKRLREMSPADFALLIEKDIDNIKDAITFHSHQKDIVASNVTNLALSALMFLKVHGFPNQKPIRMRSPRAPKKVGKKELSTPESG